MRIVQPDIAVSETSSCLHSSTAASTVTGTTTVPQRRQSPSARVQMVSDARPISRASIHRSTAAAWSMATTPATTVTTVTSVTPEDPATTESVSGNMTTGADQISDMMNSTLTTVTPDGNVTLAQGQTTEKSQPNTTTVSMPSSTDVSGNDTQTPRT